MKKIISFLLIVIMLPSYLFSFLPWKIDKDFSVEGNGGEEGFVTVNSESLAATKSVDGETGKLSFDFGGAKCDWFNYFGIKYQSDAYVKGEITYVVKEQEHTEEFFLEPCETEAVFHSFIDNCLEKVKAYKLCTLTLAPLDKAEAKIELLGIGLFNREIPDENIFIKNDTLKLGIDLNWGGALSYLEDLDSNVQAVKKDGRIFVDSNASKRYGVRSVNNHVNLINRYDTGRLVQQSYYSPADETYENGEYNGSVWNYNPVQGGNKYNDCSKIVDLVVNENSLYIKCRPLDWAKSAEDITPSYMEATYTLDKDLVKVSCRFVDFSGYDGGETTQEMPAFYCIEPFNRFVYCSQDGSLAYENKLIFWPDAGYPNFDSKENWAAFVGEFDDSFGIGLYVPDNVSFLAGVYNRETTSQKDPSVDVATSYIAAVKDMNFESFKSVEYEYCLATGTAEEIRESFAEIRAAQ